MRKKRYQNLQKLAEQRRAAMAASGPDGETAPTVAKSHVSHSSHSPIDIICGTVISGRRFYFSAGTAGFRDAAIPVADDFRAR